MYTPFYQNPLIVLRCTLSTFEISNNALSVPIQLNLVVEIEMLRLSLDWLNLEKQHYSKKSTVYDHKLN